MASLLYSFFFLEFKGGPRPLYNKDQTVKLLTKFIKLQQKLRKPQQASNRPEYQNPYKPHYIPPASETLAKLNQFLSRASLSRSTSLVSSASTGLSFQPLPALYKMRSQSSFTRPSQVDGEDLRRNSPVCSYDPETLGLSPLDIEHSNFAALLSPS